MLKDSRFWTYLNGVSVCEVELRNMMCNLLMNHLLQTQISGARRLFQSIVFCQDDVDSALREECKC